MQDNQTKTLYSFSCYSWELGKPPKEWTVEKETPKTYTVTHRERDDSQTVTVRKATMEHWGDTFALSRDEAEKKQREHVERLIAREREKISTAEKKLAEYEHIYGQIAGKSEG